MNVGLQRYRGFKNALAMSLAVLAAALGLAVLGWILWTTLSRGLSAFSLALFTEATEVSSRSATSAAGQRSTSHKISAARCLGGRCWSAEMNARRTVARPSATSAGSAKDPRTRRSGTTVAAT